MCKCVCEGVRGVCVIKRGRERKSRSNIENFIRMGKLCIHLPSSDKFNTFCVLGFKIGNCSLTDYQKLPYPYLHYFRLELESPFQNNAVGVRASNITVFGKARF